jgi:hypothetical protein
LVKDHNEGWDLTNLQHGSNAFSKKDLSLQYRCSVCAAAWALQIERGHDEIISMQEVLAAEDGRGVRSENFAMMLSAS